MSPDTASTSVAPAPTHEDPNQFALLRQRRFAPLFLDAVLRRGQ